ncbi:DUF4314 domain-containing protein [Actinomadura sp. SCN-SB]|uniref:DUF4314 domain-containing protein n=1 Tax=Actinomadura sp. SCN-SB TaxID=3373092 RepID=UPI0037537B7C
MPDHPRRDPADVLDHATGKVRVLARQCATCIFRSSDPMHLGPERIREVIEENLKAGALLTCHATLPYGQYPHFGPAVCAGFWARHRNAVPAGRLAQLLLGTIRIPPPAHDNDHCQEAPMPHDSYGRSPGKGQVDSAPLRGRRIRLICTCDPHTRLQPGALGTVTGVDSLGTLLIHWDEGSRLGLIPDEDEFEILDPTPPDTGDTC